jgi:hypothetical protein
MARRIQVAHNSYSDSNLRRVADREAVGKLPLVTVTLEEGTR